MSAPVEAPPSLSVIVLAYNEAENVRPVIEELRAWLDAHVPDAELVFVDDGSTDGTAALAREALTGRAHVVLEHDRNRGIGAAIKTGVSACHASWVTFLPADGQIAPEAIGTLMAARQDDTEVVFSVYEDRDDGMHRKVLSWGVRTLILGIHGVQMRSDGPYLFRRALFVPEQLEPDTFFLNFEFPMRVVRARLPYETVTISCRPRLAGHSKSANVSAVIRVARELVELRGRTVREALERALG
ncbi:MAG: glycosyltransferase family 2 protein [Polyangiales bacterium]|nr:glycosyltransferase family 2 protein [Myxococcales bacterium]MCB9659083.1 glycosyltransferase family 2 protein [Sandaracinaceae bacterium]